MAKGSDNRFPSVLMLVGSAPAVSPDPGTRRLFIDVADGVLKQLDESGDITAVIGTGATGPVGPPGPMGPVGTAGVGEVMMSNTIPAEPLFNEDETDWVYGG